VKTIKRVWMVVLATILIGVLIAGCAPAAQPTPTPTTQSPSPTPTVAPTTATIKIGLSLATLQEERWVRDQERIQQECKDRGIELFTQVANMDAAKQQQQCESMLTQGIDVLIIAPHDATAAAAIVEKAKAAGVPVISYDRLIMNVDDPNMVYISFDNVKVGELQGKYITEKVPKGNYVIMSGAPTDNNAKLFKQGAMNFIQPLIDSGAIKVVLDQAVVDWKPDNAMKIMEQALTKASNDVQGVLAPNDGTAGGAIQALAAQGLAGKVPITGQDAELAAAQRIVQGLQSMTVFKDTRNLGTAAVEAALLMTSGKIPSNANQVVNNDKVDVKSILLTPVAVDKANIDAILIDSGYLKKEDVYK